MATVFFSYSHADEALRDELEVHLAMLKRQGVIETWHDRRIGAGQELDREIGSHIETDDIILLLVSPNFLASEYCYAREMLRAMERHEAGDAIVIPVILRLCEWHQAPFGKLMATPPDGKPVTQWPDRDLAFLEVTKAIRGAAERLGAAAQRHGSAAAARPSATPRAPTAPPGSTAAARSSNMRVAKQFTEREKDAFQHEAFEYMAKFFENSIAELAERNPGIEGTFRRIDANQFTAVVYRGGHAVSQCKIFMGGRHFGGIAYSSSDDPGTSSFNESLSVEADEQKLFLRSMGMAHFGSGDRDSKLSLEGAAELYWGMLIRPLQDRY